MDQNIIEIAYFYVQLTIICILFVKKICFIDSFQEEFEFELF